MNNSLQGKIALVTGGARGMGAAIVRTLAAQGAAVAFTYSSSATQADALAADIINRGGRALALQADSGNPAAVRAAVAGTAQHFSGLDILVNNAGIAINGPIEDYTLENFDRMVDVNVRGVFVAVQAALTHLREGGRIINIGSIMSDYAIFPTATVYTMTKAAVAGLTRGLARDLGARGITVNNVQPGPVNTEMNPDNGPAADLMRSMMPYGKFGEGEDIANVVAFLASPEARFITGAQLRVDGGTTA